MALLSLSTKLFVFFFLFVFLTMQVFDFSPMKESRRTCVSFEALNGKWPPFRPSARMHSFSAKSDLLISAPSIPVKKKKKKMRKKLREIDCANFWQNSAIIMCQSVEFTKILYHVRIISWNQLFSKFFSKTIDFTKFLRKKCEREFLKFPHFGVEITEIYSHAF